MNYDELNVPHPFAPPWAALVGADAALLDAVCPAPFLPTPQHIDRLKRDETVRRKQAARALRRRLFGDRCL